MTKKHYLYLGFLMMILCLNAEARDLVSAASNLKSQLILVGSAVGGISIIAGGICWSIGIAEWGKRLLIGGIVGLAITAGFSGIENFITNTVR